MLMRREVRRAVGTACPSLAHTPGLHSDLRPKPLIRAAAAHLCPAALPPHLGCCPLRGPKATPSSFSCGGRAGQPLVRLSSP